MRRVILTTLAAALLSGCGMTYIDDFRSFQTEEGLSASAKPKLYELSLAADRALRMGTKRKAVQVEAEGRLMALRAVRVNDINFALVQERGLARTVGRHPELQDLAQRLAYHQTGCRPTGRTYRSVGNGQDHPLYAVNLNCG